MAVKVVGKTKDGVKILQQPVSKRGNISMAQARSAVKRYFESKGER